MTVLKLIVLIARLIRFVKRGQTLAQGRLVSSLLFRQASLMVGRRANNCMSRILLQFDVLITLIETPLIDDLSTTIGSCAI